MIRLLPLWLLVACAVPIRAIGVVRPVEGVPVISSTNGKSLPVRAEGPGTPLQWLDGHTVEIEGVYRRGAIDVNTWRVIEGLHGLSVWAGRLEAHPQGLAIRDEAAGAYYLLDPEASEDLADWVGKVVLLEGFVDGTFALRVLYHRPLFDEAADDR